MDTIIHHILFRTNTGKRQLDVVGTGMTKNHSKPSSPVSLGEGINTMHRMPVS